MTEFNCVVSKRVVDWLNTFQMLESRKSVVCVSDRYKWRENGMNYIIFCVCWNCTWSKQRSWHTCGTQKSASDLKTGQDLTPFTFCTAVVIQSSKILFYVRVKADRLQVEFLSTKFSCPALVCHGRRNTEQADVAVTPWTCFREVPNLNLGRNTNRSDRCFEGFLTSSWEMPVLD